MNKPGSNKNWILAIRPKTLPAAAGPVLIGFGLAYREGLHHFPSVILAALVALLIQAGTNMVNDYSDFKKGVDTESRVGPVRVTQAGLISPERMKAGMLVVLILIIIFSIPLVLRGGVPILIIGVLSVISGILYTAGPFPLGYNGLGDIFVLIFFGPVATAGTYYVQTLELSQNSVLAGLGPGLLSVAILSINNLRDYDDDRVSGKNTLVVLFGRIFGKAEYLFSVVIAMLIPVIIFLAGERMNYSIMVLLLLIMAIKPLKIIIKNGRGSVMNEMLGFTGRMLLAYSLIFSIGWQYPI
ncbi:MAG: 1,4-dihydroxy-2-naphthoate polyprenyltransferase [Candidatus Aminicenantes bacterium]|nr:1,4-dihydroxy-2-naphthoate polyprenyltransferase [Candidatus Aminicenantes bacterium]